MTMISFLFILSAWLSAFSMLSATVCTSSHLKSRSMQSLVTDSYGYSQPRVVLPTLLGHQLVVKLPTTTVQMTAVASFT